MVSEEVIEPDAKDVLQALAIRKNVILAGPPGTGKSRLLNQVRELFLWDAAHSGADPSGRIPIPPLTSPLPEWFPSASQTESREVFPTVFDQNTKYRDVMRGLVPRVDAAGAFTVTSGTLYRASLHAMKPGSAALVVIDEINRGPAVAAFGSALVGLEADKRLPSHGTPTAETQYFEILGDDGRSRLFALPEDLYVLAAMNEADTSVEPLDVAFLRRFHLHRLQPQAAVLRTHLGLSPFAAGALASTPAEASDWYEALAQAFERTNERIRLGRGDAYQLGHGALMHAVAPAGGLANAQIYVSEAWSTLRAHIDEVFFGDTRAIAEVLLAEHGSSPYRLLEATFAGQSVRRVTGPDRPTAEELYRLLATIASS